MLTTKMVDALNEQVNKELYSAYLYLCMSAFSSEKGFDGVANWFYVQAQEEMIHADKFYKYILQQGNKVDLKAIEKPEQKFSSVVALFEKTLEHEKFVTSLINKLVKIAKDENDKATEIFLQWFVSEQVEEEENAQKYFKKFNMVGNEGSGLLILDTELAARVFTPPLVTTKNIV
jgi:ferritin